MKYLIIIISILASGCAYEKREPCQFNKGDVLKLKLNGEKIQILYTYKSSCTYDIRLSNGHAENWVKEWEIGY